MITKEQIEKIVNEANKGTDRFLVDLKIDVGNKITIEMDAFSGFSIGDCVKVSRFIEEKLDSEKDDFELNVSSPGAEKPFKVPQQYKKHIGRTLKVKSSDGIELQGKLLEADEKIITIETSVKEKVEGKKSKEIVVRQNEFQINNIKEAKIILSFK
jgi:ribosome maturation factor RimP